MESTDNVDPRAPRFGQTLTALLTFAGVITATPELVLFVAVVLAVAVSTTWRVDLWAWLWRHVAVRIVGPTDAREPVAPHRFASLLGATATSVAALCLYSGLPAVGYALAALVALLAGLAAVADVCLACRFYREVGVVRRLGLV
jgi:hypothetical protein